MDECVSSEYLRWKIDWLITYSNDMIYIVQGRKVSISSYPVLIYKVQRARLASRRKVASVSPSSVVPSPDFLVQKRFHPKIAHCMPPVLQHYTHNSYLARTTLPHTLTSNPQKSIGFLFLTRHHHPQPSPHHHDSPTPSHKIHLHHPLPSHQIHTSPPPLR